MLVFLLLLRVFLYDYGDFDSWEPSGLRTVVESLILGNTRIKNSCSSLPELFHFLQDKAKILLY